jgi:amidohydrolase
MADELLTPFHDWLVELRRHFHQFPELAYREQKTAAKIGEVLDTLGVSYQTGVGKTGVVACIHAQQPGPTIALRGDMDALPLEEANDVTYRSKLPGVMHACGHDAHITILLGVIRWLLETNWPAKGRGKILFLFQPAEEGGAGAKAMLDSGVFHSENIAAIFAAHVHPELVLGQIGVAPNVSHAASATVRIRLIGKGGHGAHPHLCADPIVAGAYLITGLQSIISRNTSPLDNAVLTIGRFQAGTAVNIIPNEAQIDGTLRTLRSETQELIETRLREMVTGVELAHKVSGDLSVVSGYPLLVNDSTLVQFCIEECRELFGESQVTLQNPVMGAEDFAYFSQMYPALMIRLGCKAPDWAHSLSLHSPYFDLDERVLDVGVRLFARLLTNYYEKVGQIVRDNDGR